MIPNPNRSPRRECRRRGERRVLSGKGLQQEQSGFPSTVCESCLPPRLSIFSHLCGPYARRGELPGVSLRFGPTQPIVQKHKRRSVFADNRLRKNWIPLNSTNHNQLIFPPALALLTSCRSLLLPFRVPGRKLSGRWFVGRRPPRAPATQQFALALGSLNRHHR